MPTNADLIRASYDAFRRGDLDAALALFHPEIAWTHPDGMSDYGLGGTKRGHAEVRAFMKHARTLFQEIRPMPREFLESGNRVVVLGTHSMRSARTGRSCTVDFVHSWVLESGKAIHFTDLHDTTPVRRLFEPVEPDRAQGRFDLDDQGFWQVLRTGLGFWESRVLLSAVELNLFTILVERPLELSELTRRLGLHPRGARDFFDALVALGFLERDGALYKNARGASTFLNRMNPEFDMTALLEVADAHWYDTWRHLTAALRTGQPQSKATVGEGDHFDVLYADPLRVEKWQRAMHAGSVGTTLALAEKFPWREYQTLADIGCAAGSMLRRVLSRHAHLYGIGFDLAPLAPSFERAAVEAGLAKRMRFTAGSFFSDPLPPANVISFGHVLHDWDLPTKRMLLQKAFDALPPGGAVVVYDMMIDDERSKNAFGMMMSLHVLLESPGGFDYTGADCLTWLNDAGFQGCYIEHLGGSESMAVGFKK
jgi:ketosteroid isomerase-like protein